MGSSSVYIDRKEVMEITGMSRTQLRRIFKKLEIQQVKLDYYKQKVFYLREEFERKFPFENKENIIKSNIAIRKGVADDIYYILSNDQ